MKPREAERRGDLQKDKERVVVVVVVPPPHHYCLNNGLDMIARPLRCRSVLVSFETSPFVNSF